MTRAHTHRNHMTSEEYGSDQARGPTITARLLGSGLNLSATLFLRCLEWGWMNVRPM